MATPHDLRRDRLKVDCERMYGLKGKIIEWRAINGPPPYVEEYEIHFNIKSITSAEPSFASHYIYRVVLPGNYPYAAPINSIQSKEKPFHPNFYRNGQWCHGKWLSSQFLSDYVIRLARSLQFDAALIDMNPPANSEAAEWYTRNLKSTLFPTDRQSLPTKEIQRPRLRMK